MAMQVDIIPATGTDYFTSNIEDGIAFADETLRAELASRYPGAWAQDPGAARVHGRGARDRASPGRAAVLEHPGLPAAVPARARPGADGRLSVADGQCHRHCGHDDTDREAGQADLDAP